MQARKRTTKSEHSGVFGHLRDDMLAAPGLGQGRTTNGKGIALGPSAGKDDFSRGTRKQTGNLLPGRLDSRVWRLRVEVCAGRIAKVCRQVRQHGLHDMWINRRGRVIVEIDWVVCQTRM